MLLIAVLLISACGKVPMPESDDTAPNLNWSVVDGLTGDMAETRRALGEDTVFAQTPDMVIVSLVANDSEGVKRIKLSEPVMSYTCVSADATSETPAELTVEYQEETLGPDAEGLVFDQLILVDTVYFNHDCGEGLTLQSGSAIFTGEAENYFGGITQGTLVLEYAP
jgi:hypothetical protein